jgi:CHASE2 domain-containing sensor protein
VTAWHPIVTETILPARLPRPGRRWLAIELLWVLGITLAVHLLELTGVLWRWEAVGLDLMGSLAPRQQSNDIVIVQITQQDFANLFGGRRPLCPEVVEKFVDEIAKAKPRVIGIDLDLNAPRFRGPDCGIPVIWARDIVASDSSRPPGQEHHCLLSFSHEIEAVEPGKILGLELDKSQPDSGLCIFVRDADDIVRRFRREFPIRGELATKVLGSPLQSFPWAIAKTYDPCLARQDHGRAGHDLIFNFISDHYSFDRVNAGEVSALAAEPFWPNSKLIHDRIVLLGGVFAEARDDYETPVGRMAGVDLIAHAIQTELARGGVREIAIYTSIAIELLSGSLLIYLNWRFVGVGGFVVSLLFVAATFLGISYLAFRGFAYWLNFPVVMFAVLLHLQVDNLRERRKHALTHHRKVESQ